jgi:hypothetical protein
MNKLIFSSLVFLTLGMVACSDSTFDNKSRITPDPYVTPKVTPSNSPEPMFTGVPTPKPTPKVQASVANY